MALFVAAAASGQTPPKYDGASVERGKTTFVGACGFCHGSNAKGGEKGPDLLRSVLVLDDVDGTTIAPIIIKGRPEKGMPRFAFTPQQIGDIARSSQCRPSLSRAARRRGCRALLSRPSRSATLRTSCINPS